MLLLSVDKVGEFVGELSVVGEGPVGLVVGAGVVSEGEDAVVGRAVGVVLGGGVEFGVVEAGVVDGAVVGGVEGDGFEEDGSGGVDVGLGEKGMEVEGGRGEVGGGSVSTESTTIQKGEKKITDLLTIRRGG